MVKVWDLRLRVLGAVTLKLLGGKLVPELVYFIHTVVHGKFFSLVKF